MWFTIYDATISASDKSRIIITIPCDSTDAWIVAAYAAFTEHLVDNWNLVTEKCYSAKLLEQEIRRVFA